MSKFAFNPIGKPFDLVNPSPDLSAYLKLDQTTPQSVINGLPLFSEGINLGVLANADSLTADAVGNVQLGTQNSFGSTPTYRNFIFGSINTVDSSLANDTTVVGTQNGLTTGISANGGVIVGNSINSDRAGLGADGLYPVLVGFGIDNHNDYTIGVGSMLALNDGGDIAIGANLNTWDTAVSIGSGGNGAYNFGGITVGSGIQNFYNSNPSLTMGAGLTNFGQYITLGLNSPYARFSQSSVIGNQLLNNTLVANASSLGNDLVPPNAFVGGLSPWTTTPASTSGWVWDAGADGFANKTSDSSATTGTLQLTVANMSFTPTAGAIYRIRLDFEPDQLTGLTQGTAQVKCFGTTLDTINLDNINTASAGTVSYDFVFTATNATGALQIVASKTARFSMAGLVIHLQQVTGGSLYAAGKIASPTTFQTLGAGATTTAITNNVVKVTGDAGGNTLATITGGTSGQELVLLFVDALVTITDTAATTANTVNLSAAFTSAANTVLTLVYDGNKWFEKSRSVN